MTDWERGTVTEVRRGSRLAPLLVLAALVAAAGGFAAVRASADAGGEGVVADSVEGAARTEPDAAGASPHAGSPVRGPAQDWGGDSGWGLGPLERVLIRNAPGGVDVRLYRGGPGTQPPESFEAFRDQPVCDPDSWVLLELSNHGAVGMAYPQPAHLPDGANLLAVGVFGVDEGDPAWWVAVQATPEAAAVQGGGDLAEFVDGWAVLAGPGDLPVGDVEVLDADGGVLATLPLGGEPRWCVDPGSAPPVLPEPGEQPDDPAATEAAVRQAYADAWNHDVPPEIKELAVEDAAELAEAREQVAANFPDAVATVTVEVYEVVFTAPDAAAVRFELRYSGGAQFGEQLGHAVLRDGRWQVTRETTCMVLSWGGGGC